MNLYLVSQNQNNDYDTYDSFVIAAASEDIARDTDPSGNVINWEENRQQSYGSWCKRRSDVTVKLIGTAASDVAAGIILASFNAG